MRAIVATAIGGPEVLQMQEWPDPQPAAGQVLIRVAYAGVNFAEVMQRRGESVLIHAASGGVGTTAAQIEYSVPGRSSRNPQEQRG